jgi:hypothetical protein
MARKVFYSFHYNDDNWRAAQVRNIGAIEGNSPVSSNKWEEIKEGGSKVIQTWIDGELKGKTCTIVLIGTNTAGRKWIDYEIKKSWDDGKGLLGIYIHNLLNYQEKNSAKGKNPFAHFTIGEGSNEKYLSSVVKAYDPPYLNSKNVYSHIKDNIADWVEEAIKIRNN